MYKEKLRQLKRINATPAMVRITEDRDIRTYKDYWGYKVNKKGKYDLLVRCQTRKGILMICIFFPSKVAAGELTPTYEIYCNPEGDEYITRVMNDGAEVRWSESMADNLQDLYRIYSDNYGYCSTLKGKRIWQNPEGKETIRRFLNTKEPGLEGLVEWQRKVKRKKTEDAEAREKAPWDKDMALVPELPPSFENWMKKQSPDNYIFYHYKDGGADEGFCSHCGRWVPIKSPRHGKMCRCVKCGTKAKYKSSGKISTLSTSNYACQIVQKYKGGLVIRTFYMHQWYRGKSDIQSPMSTMHENERILMSDNGTLKKYVFGMYKNKEHRWIPGSLWPGEQKNAGLYKRNLGILKGTIYQNSTIALWDRLPVSIDYYLKLEQQHPVLEKLIKAGLSHVARELIINSIGMRNSDDFKWLEINEKETELARMLKIDTARLKRLKEMDGGRWHLRWLQWEKLTDTIWPDDMIRDFSKAGITYSSFSFLYSDYKITKVWRYLAKQKEKSGEEMLRLKRTWEDYLNMANNAKMNTQNSMILYPKDLRDAHQRMILLLQEGEMEKEAQKLERKWPKVNKVLPDLKKFEFTRDGYTIVVPASILDIVKEGHALQHCVHTCDFYFDRIQKHESYLFFLRKAETPDIPWYTLEVEPSGNIRQKRTTGDNQGKDLEEAVKFLKAWQKDFSKKLTQEEKELGKKADQARRREYSRLRDDGNKVWHGRLAGQLLADVLEQDFMAAGT